MFARKTCALPRLFLGAVGLVAIACGSATITPAPSGPAPSTAQPDAVALVVEVVVDGLDQPIDIASPGDGSGRVFIVEQPGRIRTVQDGRLASEPFLDIVDRIASGGERGLLGLALHPDFPTDPRLFVNYTDINGDTVVAEYRLAASGNAADPDSERILIQIDQPYPNHNGGAVVFGPDGMLYISTGDGGSGGDPHGNGQRLDTLLGKVLRIDVGATPTGELAYAIPGGNPFVAEPNARPEIWLTGLRNPWRIRFDGETGNLWIGDVGQGAWEEIDVAPAGVGGLNFGWNRMEGFDCFGPGFGCDETGLTLPVAAYGHEFGCAVIGGVVVRDPDQPSLDGGYLFSDSCSGRLWLLDAAINGRQDASPIGATDRSISSIELHEGGTVLATDRGNGALVRIKGVPR
jgi:hypothetical protein